VGWFWKIISLSKLAHKKMSIQFNDTSTYKGLVQRYEREIGANFGDISGNTTLLKDFTAEVNITLDEIFRIGFSNSGTWQLDDNSTYESDGTTLRGYPIIKANIVSGQRDYSFLTDDYGNYILDIYRVFAKVSSSGVYKEIFPIDVQSENDITSFVDGLNTSGTPTRYDKTSNGIFLDPVPNYNSTLGLMVYVNREPSYFVSTNTTKVAGIPGNLHRYLYLRPALNYARNKNLSNYQKIADEVLKYEGDEDRGIIGIIARTFGRRERDIKRRLTANRESTK
jgi:hypothetical protein